MPPRFYPQAMGPWAHHTSAIPSMPARIDSRGHSDHGFQPNVSGAMDPVLQPYSMPAYTVPPPHGFPRPQMHYGYPPKMMSGPPPPGALTMYRRPTTSQPIPFGPMGFAPYQSVPGYMISPMPGHEGMGIMPPMVFPMFGGYPNQPTGYPDCGDICTYHTHHMANGYNMEDRSFGGTDMHHETNSPTDRIDQNTPGTDSKVHSTGDNGSSKTISHRQARQVPTIGKKSKVKTLEN